MKETAVYEMQRVALVKNCITCGHRHGKEYEYAKCLLSGYYCSTERTYPTRCGMDFSGWVQRPPSPPRRTLWQRLREAVRTGF